MRRRYTGMTPSMMWRAPEEDPKNEEGKKADKQLKKDAKAEKKKARKQEEVEP